MKKLPEENFLSEEKNYLSAQRVLEICINIVIDIGSHIVSLNSSEKPENYSDIMTILTKINIISSELKDKLIKMVRFRNLLGHFYLEIDNKEIYKILQNDLDDFDLFEKAILSKIEKNSINSSTKAPKKKNFNS